MSFFGLQLLNYAFLTCCDRPYCGIEPTPQGSPANLHWSASASDKMELIQVHTLIRHGDRLPANAGTCWYAKLALNAILHQPSQS